MSGGFSCVVDEPGMVLTIVGDLDADTAPQVIETAATITRPLTRIDCRSVPFVSATGIASLLQVCRFNPLPVDASPEVRRLIEMCDLQTVLVVDVDTEDP